MIERLAGVPRLLVACDFDGTLAPIVDDPDEAAATSEALSALRRLATAPGTTVAIISGRLRDDLTSRFDGEGFVLIGEHGADPGTEPPPESAALADARRLVESAVARLPGSRVEHKTRSVVFHYRRAASDPGSLLADLRKELSRLEGMEVMEGKAVLEIAVGGDDKGDAVVSLRNRLGADAVLFVGDDVTDERVFPRLGPDDVGIKVGSGPTAASHRVADPAAVAELLDELARKREQR